MTKRERQIRIFTILNYMYSHKSWYCLTREKGENGYEPKGTCDAIFRLVDEKNVADTTRFENEKYESVFRKMMQQGEYGLFGYFEGRCVYRIWAKMGGTERYLKKTVLKIKDNEAYIHYVFTDEKARGNGIHTLGVKNLCEMFPDKRWLTLVMPNNIASIRGFEKNGFKKELRIDVFYVLGVPFVCKRRIKKM